jgi:uncharacterized protein DUF1707/2TM domain-containing protein
MPMANAPDIRASDAERERVAGQLRDHAAEGRLDVEELDDRLRRAYAARTRAELDTLTSDLPAPAPRRTPAPARRRPQARDQVVAYAAVMTLLVVIWALTGAGYFWPVWPALGWGVALVTGKGHMHRPHRPHRIL